MNKKDKTAKAIALDNSELLDVHTWSDYPEVNDTVTHIYEELKKCTSISGNKTIEKKHIKVLVLDLYVKWSSDPERYVSLYRRVVEYKAKHNRYNKLHISKKIIDVLDYLLDNDYVEQSIGTYARTGIGKSKITRVRATDKLINIINNNYKIKPDMIGRLSSTECIVLREYDDDENKKVDIQYPDTPETIRMRKDLCAYNNLLYKTYIDIPTVTNKGIERKDGKIVHITQHDKFIRRIFSNGTFSDGGRFYGGWWQRISEEWRSQIRIWNMPISEIDYSGFHIVLLYAVEGIDYWKTINKDPYELDNYEKSEQMREILKDVLLMSINSSDIEGAVKAVRWEINKDMENKGWIYDTEYDLKQIIKDFAELHKPIYKHFFSGAGIKLQNIDSFIAETIINEYTQDNIPVLCIHDSFIIQADKAEDLKKSMEKALQKAVIKLGTDTESIKTKVTGMPVGKWNILLSRPEYRDEMIDTLQKAPYDYQEWNQKMKEFKAKELGDYYIAEEYIDKNS